MCVGTAIVGTIRTVKGINSPEILWRLIVATSNLLVLLVPVPKMERESSIVSCGCIYKHSANPLVRKDHWDPSSKGCSIPHRFLRLKW